MTEFDTWRDDATLEPAVADPPDTRTVIAPPPAVDDAPADSVADVIQQVDDGEITESAAARLLDVSKNQIKAWRV